MLLPRVNFIWNQETFETSKFDASNNNPISQCLVTSSVVYHSFMVSYTRNLCPIRAGNSKTWCKSYLIFPTPSNATPVIKQNNKWFRAHKDKTSEEKTKQNEQTCRIVTSIFQSLKTTDQKFQNVFPFSWNTEV